jgi:hypothetical protein
MFYVGIVGHRYFADQGTETFVREECTGILKQAKVDHGELVALSALAEGADTLFAEAALALGIPLEIVRPFRDYNSDFETTLSRERYEKFRAVARMETKAAYESRSDLAYQAAMRWIVEKSDYLVVVWDGLQPEGAGGTGDAAKRARLLNKSWTHLDVTDLTVKSHLARPARV